MTPGPGSYNTDAVSYGKVNKEPSSKSMSIAGRDRYEWKNWAPAPTRYKIPYTFGTGSVDKSGGKSWSIPVSAHMIKV